MSLFIQMVAAVVDAPLSWCLGCLGSWNKSRNPDINMQRMLTFGTANPRLRGSGGSGPGRPTGMPQEGTRIYGYGGDVFRRRLYSIYIYKYLVLLL